MEIKTTYIGTKNGVTGFYCGFKPEGVEIKEVRNVLYPKEDYILKNKTTGETLSSVWLKDGDNKENYEEIAKPANSKS